MALKIEGLGAITKEPDAVTKELRENKNLSYDLFVWVHGGCPGYENNGTVASCSTDNVVSREAPVGYISK